MLECLAAETIVTLGGSVGLQMLATGPSTVVASPLGGKKRTPRPSVVWTFLQERMYQQVTILLRAHGA